MKLVYITSKKYPGKTADHSFVKKQAEAFKGVLGSDFIFVINGYLDGGFGDGVVRPFLSLKRGKVVFYFIWIPFLYWRLRKEKVFFFSNDAYLLSILIWWRKVLGFKYKIVSDWHQLFIDWRDKYVSQGSDYLITTTKVLKDRLVRDFEVDSNKILVAYGGVDLELFNSVSDDKEYLRKGLSLPLDKKLIGYVGGFKTMGMDKGVGDIIESLNFLDDNFIAVLVGGNKEEQEEYKKKAQDFEVLERCIFIDRQEEKNLIKYEKAMDVLVIPYPNKEHFREWGFPMKTYEYMASGVPIIYSDLPILREVLNGQAVSFEAENSLGLSEKIKSIKDFDSGRAYSMVGKYTWDKRVKNILEFIGK